MLPLAAIGRGVHSMVIECVPGPSEEGLDVLLQTRNLWGRTMSGIGS